MYYEDIPVAAIGRTPAETRVYKYVECTLVEKTPTTLSAICKPNALIKVYRQEGDSVEYFVEFVDTDTGISEKHKVDLSTAIVIRRYLESRSS